MPCIKATIISLYVLPVLLSFRGFRVRDLCIMWVCKALWDCNCDEWPEMFVTWPTLWSRTTDQTFKQRTTISKHIDKHHCQYAVTSLHEKNISFKLTRSRIAKWLQNFTRDGALLWIWLLGHTGPLKSSKAVLCAGHAHRSPVKLNYTLLLQYKLSSLAACSQWSVKWEINNGLGGWKGMLHFQNVNTGSIQRGWVIHFARWM